MKIRAQIGMVLNLDKCIGCHTCSVTCKNVWTNRPGTEYIWFNNVETKPRRRLSEELGRSAEMDGRLGTAQRQAAAAPRLQAGTALRHFCQPKTASDRRLLRAVYL